MDSVFEVGDVVSLNEDVRLFVLRRFEYLGEIYIALINVKDISEEKAVLILAREVIKNEKAYLDLIDDEEDIAELLAYLDKLNGKK